MVKIPIKFTKAKKFLIKLPETLAKHVFLTFLVLIFIAFILGGFIFYKYSFLVEKIEPQITKNPFQIEKNLFQKILNVWQEREKKFKETESKIPFDLFRGI